MALLSDESIAEQAQERENYRLTNVSSKLNRDETERLDALARKRGLQRGELIRQIILAELAQDAEPPPPDPLLAEIIGVRLLVVNLLKPRKEGEKPLTPEAFDAMASEIHRMKKGLAVKLQQEAETR